MNKKYIDFVPIAKEVKKEPVRRVNSGASQDASRSGVVDEVTVAEIFEERVVKPRAGVTMVRKQDIVAPKARFVNTERVAKRPLSKSAKNVYVNKVVKDETKEGEKDGAKDGSKAKPVRIIDKPKKDSKAGMAVAIIITIILGAAAGTVAFLLLPK